MTFPETRSQRRWRGSWAAAASGLLLAAGACSSSPSASASPSPSPSATVQPTPSVSVAPTGEVTVAQHVLPPATDPPVAQLCSAAISTTADGNAVPLLCHTGAVNVQAWNFYASVSASILGLGLNPTAGQAQSAICDDLNHNHATRIEEASGYKLAAAYYGWTFNINVATVPCS